MAEIKQGSGAQKSDGKIRTKKHSIKMDMTPMVDLAFLLLTFFILTSALSKHRIMELTMPEKVDAPQPVNHKNILNLVLAEDNKIYWWQGLTPPAEVTNFSKNGVRKLLFEKSKANPKLVVLIKPKDKSKYHNMVDILDEMTITKIERYAIVDFTNDDKMIITGNLH